MWRRSMIARWIFASLTAAFLALFLVVTHGPTAMAEDAAAKDADRYGRAAGLQGVALC
jgi:hypothetical protein